MVGAWHGRCESDTAALCKENDILNPYLHGMAGERHAMCESALKVPCMLTSHQDLTIHGGKNEIIL